MLYKKNIPRGNIEDRRIIIDECCLSAQCGHKTNSNMLKYLEGKCKEHTIIVITTSMMWEKLLINISVT